MPVAVELNGLLPGLGPGRGAPGRGPGPPDLGAPGRGAPGPWVLGADGLTRGPGWSGRPAGTPGRCPRDHRARGTRSRGPGRGPLGRPGALGTPWSPGWPLARSSGLRKSAGVTAGWPGLLRRTGHPRCHRGRPESARGTVAVSRLPGRAGMQATGGTGGSGWAAVSGAAGPAVPLTAAPSGAAARSAEPLAVSSGTVLGRAPQPSGRRHGRAVVARMGSVPAPTSGRGLARPGSRVARRG